MKPDARPRLLAIDLSDGTARYSVLADDQQRLGDADRGFTFGGSVSAREQVDDLVVRLVAGTADSDINPQLTNLGIGYVWVTGQTMTSRPGSITRLVWALPAETSAGSSGSSNRRWREQSSSTGLRGCPLARRRRRCQQEGSSGSFRSVSSADVRWQAELNDTALAPVSAGWQQVFVLPAEGGTVAHTPPSLMPWLLPPRAWCSWSRGACCSSDQTTRGA